MIINLHLLKFLNLLNIHINFKEHIQKAFQLNHLLGKFFFIHLYINIQLDMFNYSFLLIKLYFQQQLLNQKQFHNLLIYELILKIRV